MSLSQDTGNQRPHANADTPTLTARRFEAGISARSRRSPLPVNTPNSAGYRLLAMGPDPVESATTAVRTALAATQEAQTILESVDPDLREAFEFAQRQLDLAARMVSEVSIVAIALTPLRRSPGVQLSGDLPAVLGAPTLGEPALTAREPLYGLRTTLRAALAYLGDAVGALGNTQRRGAVAHLVLGPLGRVALGAAYVERAAEAVVAHAYNVLSPGTPTLPGVGGDVELYAGAHALPVRRWAMRSRIRFTPGRVEVVTSTGRISIGHVSPIGSLLWVAPPVRTRIEEDFDPSEQWADLAEHDELGTIHVLDTTGRSVASFVVADWASQPTTVVDQALVDSTAGDIPLGAARGIWAVESLGFTRGATTIGVPLVRGLAHPPSAEGAHGPLRPGPHKQPYTGRQATPAAAAKRRLWRHRAWNRDIGPGTPIAFATRPLAPYLVAFAPLVLWPAGGRTWFQWAFLIATLIALVEPWAGWLWALGRDIVARPRRTATYRVGSILRGRSTLSLNGRDLVVRTASGHETWLPGPADADLGVVRIVRLLEGDRAWGFALADARGRWRAVLPALIWTPGGKYERLEAFARSTRLELADQEARVLPRLGREVVSAGSDLAAQRTWGPRVRGLFLLGCFAVPATAISLAGPTRSLNIGLVSIAICWGGAVLLGLTSRLRLGRPPLP